MTTSSISIYQQQAAKLFSRKSVVLGIPIAAGSIILFLQWRKRKSLKPKPKPKSKPVGSEEKDEKPRVHTSNGQATASAVVAENKTAPEAPAQNGSAPAPAASASSAATPAPTGTDSYAAVAAAPPPAAAAAAAAAVPSPVPQYSPVPPKHTQDDADDQRVTGFAYAKRPRLGRGRSVEKFASYEPLRKASAEQREQDKKLRIKEEDDKAAAAAVAAFGATASSAGVVGVPKNEEVSPEAPVPAAAPSEEPAVAPKDASTDVKVNGWHHFADEEQPEPVRDMRRPSIVATFEITTSSEPANTLSPPGSAEYDTSRRPSVVTTISAEPPINEEDEDADKGDNEVETEQEQAFARSSRRESVTVETAIEIAETWSNGMNGTIHEEEDNAPMGGVSTFISGPISVGSSMHAGNYEEEEMAAVDSVPEAVASSALAKAMENGVQGDEQAKRTDSPLAGKPVVVAAAAGVPAPQSAVVEEIKDAVERSPLAHLPGMGIPNSA